MVSLRSIGLAAIFGLAITSAAQAQGNGPGFHAAAIFGGGCPASDSQTVSAPSAPAAAGPVTVPCISGSATAAGEAGASTLRASSLSAHVCCGTGSASNGRARIQIENVVITGPDAPSIPVSLNFQMRGTLTSHPNFGQAGVFLFVRLSGFNTLMQSTSAIDMSSIGILNQTGVFAPLSLGFPAAGIDQAFATPPTNAAPNQPLRLDFEMMAYSDMAGLGATESDFVLALPFGVPVFNLPPGYTVSIPELNIFDNFVALPTTISGDVFIVGTNASEISLGTVEHVTGSVSIGHNQAATSIDLGALTTVDGNVSIDHNQASSSIDLAALTTVNGNVSIDHNQASSSIDLSALRTVGGGVNVSSNAPCTSLILGALLTVTGNLTLEPCGSGAFSLGSTTVGGDANVGATGYNAVSGLTAKGATTISNATADARVTVHLPAGSFAVPVSFSLTRLDPLNLAPEAGLAVGGAAATIDPIAAYQITFAVPTLNRHAWLTFDVYLAGLDTATAAALLDAVTDGTATLVTRGDTPGARYQSFAVCGDAEIPTADGCVQVQLLDANEQPTSTPAIIRFVGVVGHFSTWGVALVSAASTEVFVFDGLLPPYPAPPYGATPAFNRGRVIPLKFAWADASGARTDSAGATPSVTIHPLNCASLAPSTAPITPEDAGGSGGLRYDAETRTWIYNWNTKPLAAGCFAIAIASGSPDYEAPSSSFPVVLRNK